MKRNVKALKRWVAALRSGKFSQAIGQLRESKIGAHRMPGAEDCGFCCLGVLAHTSPKFKHVGHGRYVFTDEPMGFDDEGGFLSTISHAAMEYFGLTESEVADLIRMNDSYRNSFREIADYIEQSIIPLPPRG